MNAREKMIEYRETSGINIECLASMCDMSTTLLQMVEDGQVTHPDIVKRIQFVYDLTDEEAEELLPVNRRRHNPDYDPDRYVDIKDLSPFDNSFKPKQTKKDRKDEYAEYAHSKIEKSIRQHSKRGEY